MYQDLDDIVFEDRHKAYGAYAFRKHYDYTLTKALVIGVAVFLALFLLFFSGIKVPNTDKKTVPEDMVQMDITNMLINFGDNTNGKGIEEPKKQESSPAPLIEKHQEEVAEIEKPSIEKADKPIPENTVPVPTREKAVVVTPKASKADKKATSITTSTTTKKTDAAPKAKGNIKKEGGTGDGQGNAAIGSLLAGRGTKGSSQGTGSGIGNAGDPLGGDGDGDSKIGIDRKLVGFIPGTMGRGGAQPKHDCSGSGSISIAYTVDKAGNVISATRSSGVSDPCVVSTSVKWVKQYVKAEKSNVSSKGTYKIVF
ncbi:ferric siderophore ABC transporter substrate-binding protein [Soonwooa sp.]|uniref:ferric siderophore ABC transporter substrate-binding protein n=1 Tax=Soonwooa sp. TaxID=1938592 RepID=UPI002631701A|nr:ferric siderophore ABC transporter substrate-binding protein [Soonwooa sp.]